MAGNFEVVQRPVKISKKYPARLNVESNILRVMAHKRCNLADWWSIVAVSWSVIDKKYGERLGGKCSLAHLRVVGISERVHDSVWLRSNSCIDGNEGAINEMTYRIFFEFADHFSFERDDRMLFIVIYRMWYTYSISTDALCNLKERIQNTKENVRRNNSLKITLNVL